MQSKNLVCFILYFQDFVMIRNYILVSYDNICDLSSEFHHAVGPSSDPAAPGPGAVGRREHTGHQLPHRPRHV